MRLEPSGKLPPSPPRSSWWRSLCCLSTLPTLGTRHGTATPSRRTGARSGHVATGLGSVRSWLHPRHYSSVLWLVPCTCIRRTQTLQAGALTSQLCSYPSCCWSSALPTGASMEPCSLPLWCQRTSCGLCMRCLPCCPAIRGPSCPFGRGSPSALSASPPRLRVPAPWALGAPPPPPRRLLELQRARGIPLLASSTLRAATRRRRQRRHWPQPRWRLRMSVGRRPWISQCSAPRTWPPPSTSVPPSRPRQGMSHSLSMPWPSLHRWPSMGGPWRRRRS
mmetsp:Transcript_87073/g.186665  ORF Transcript_87073/g.186665 Transcript_87073/m.186665 type:complete len:278 (+) Transcript_87073:546-1379(+)